MPGRKAPCPCGSGKKYQSCCYQKDAAARGPRPPNLTRVPCRSCEGTEFVEDGRWRGKTAAVLWSKCRGCGEVWTDRTGEIPCPTCGKDHNYLERVPSHPDQIHVVCVDCKNHFHLFADGIVESDGDGRN